MADEVAELAICRCQRAFPKRLPEEAIALLAGMECDRIDEEDIEEDWLRTLVDSPYPGPVREAVKSLAAEVTRI